MSMHIKKRDIHSEILCLSGVRGDTRRYRSFHPYEQLLLGGASAGLSHLTDPGLPEKVNRSRTVIFHRTAWDHYVGELFQHTPLAILDVDDLLFDPGAFRWIDSPDFQDPLRAELYQQEMRRHQQALEAAHAVLASTDFLAEQVRLQGKPVWVHRNAFSLEMLELSEAAYAARSQERGRIVVGYASGTPTHDRDFEIARPALRHILQHFPQVELWLVGSLNPGSNWGGLAERVKRIPWVPWRKLPGTLVQFDINLAPLVIDNPFAQSKSEIKYMEAALLRVPTVASPTGAFQYAIRSGENGYLADTPAEWAGALETLIQQEGLRLEMGQRAYQHTLESYHPARRSKELLETLGHIHAQLFAESWEPAGTDSRQQPLLAFHIDPAMERTPSLARMALYSLRHRGIRTLGRQVWVYIRRLMAPIFPFRRSA